jgi:hypothetical protein
MWLTWPPMRSCWPATARNLGLGNSQGAYHLPAQTLASRRRVLGNHHPATLNSMNNLATVRPELEDL